MRSQYKGNMKYFIRNNIILFYIILYYMKGEIKTNEEREKEYELIQEAIKNKQEKEGKKKIQNPDVQKMIEIVEKFLKDKKLICYGGTAINNILPAEDQFYNKAVEFPDYDCYSPDAMVHAKELADIYSLAGYDNVLAKAGMHHGTFKVGAKLQSVADITQMDPKLYKNVLKYAMKIDGIYYAPPNYLRLNMYKELSRPGGEIDRWEKVYKRLLLLNKNFPIENPHCKASKFKRDFEGSDKSVYTIIKNEIIAQELVFFGGYAQSLYEAEMPQKKRRNYNISAPYFDVMAKNPDIVAKKIKARLDAAGISGIQIRQKPKLWEILGIHYEIVLNNKAVCCIYKPIACHSFNRIKVGGKEIKIATIDTMFTFLFAFLYSYDKEYYDHDRILCMANYLFEIQTENKLSRKGIFKRFSIECYGTNTDSIDLIRLNRAKIFNKTRKNRKSKIYQEYFLRYDPAEAVKNTGTVSIPSPVKAEKSAEKNTKYNRSNNKTNKNSNHEERKKSIKSKKINNKNYFKNIRKKILEIID